MVTLQGTMHTDRVTTKAEVQTQVVKALHDRAMAIMLTKRHDYAEEGDIFSNFRFAGYVLDWAVKRGVRGRYLDALALIATKIARLVEMLGGKEPMNEAIEDTCVDLANYALILGAMFLTERRPNGKED